MVHSLVLCLRKSNFYYKFLINYNIEPIFQFGFGNMFPHDLPRSFNTKYRAYSVSMLPGNERSDVEKGGKSEFVFTVCFIKKLIKVYDYSVFNLSDDKL